MPVAPNKEVTLSEDVMPPSPTYSWFCAAYSAANILSHAARYRATQAAPKAITARWNPPPGPLVDRKPAVPEDVSSAVDPVQKYGYIPKGINIESKVDAAVEAREHLAIAEEPTTPALEIPTIHAELGEIQKEIPLKEPEVAEVVPSLPEVPKDSVQPSSYPTRTLQSSKVPSSRLGRLFHYGGLAASLGYGAASELLRRTGDSSGTSQSPVLMTEANIKRLVSKLSQMRGAALKLGQFLSIQDTHVLPKEVDQIFRRVQDSAHYMPDWQMEQVMASSFGPNWADNFTSFDRIPFAAASIGQVHSGVLAPGVSPTGKAEPVAIKIQFPNIANSINSDLGYIKVLLTAGRLLPKGLFLDRTINVMKDELADECKYSREASFLRLFGSPSHLGQDPRYKVPWVWESSTDSVLVMERVEGTSVGDADISGLNQRDRDDIAAWVLELCLKELFEFRAMQTDPNWSNFLWNATTRQVELVDFGATREYTKEFMDNWFRLLQAAAHEDREGCIKWSLELGYLTGEENELMLDAHVRSMMLLATPFRETTHQPFSFGPGSKWTDITGEIRAQIPVMLQHRLTPPPRETYSLNRKLSGAFLLASRLGATFDTKAIWDKVISNYKVSS